MQRGPRLRLHRYTILRKRKWEPGENPSFLSFFLGRRRPIKKKKRRARAYTKLGFALVNQLQLQVEVEVEDQL